MKAGFVILRQGSHTVMSNGHVRLTVPRHNQTNACTMGAIAQETGSAANRSEISFAEGLSAPMDGKNSIGLYFVSVSLARPLQARYNIVRGLAEVDRQTIDWYDSNAEEIARRYESVPGGISDFFHFVFAPGDSVLEIGSGSGRDAARHRAHPGVARPAGRADHAKRSQRSSALRFRGNAQATQGKWRGEARRVVPGRQSRYGNRQ